MDSESGSKVDSLLRHELGGGLVLENDGDE